MLAMRRWVHIALALLIVFAAMATGFLVWRGSRPPQQTVLKYRGKSLESWFYGSRTDFFSGHTRDAAQKALLGVGTNAFPFLLATLINPQGDSAVYLKAYQLIPGQLKARVSCPISTDDIRAVSLNHMWQMRDRLSKEDLQALADCVSNLRNPRIRMHALALLREKYEGTPPFTSLCRKLLDDPDPAIRLEAAIPLAEAAIISDPAEPKLALTLLPALESKELRQHWADLNQYSYCQQPPGSLPKGATLYLPGRYSADQGEALKRRIRVALIRLEPYLEPQQKARFNELDKLQRLGR